MSRKIKLYTKTGDKGLSSLYDGSRVPKFNIIFNILGDLDELNSHIGLLCSYEENNKLRKIQLLLTNIASIIATPKNNKILPKEITNQEIKELEKNIDFYEEQNTPLKEFVLPGINLPNAQSHICRSTTRRVERKLWEFCTFLENDNVKEQLKSRLATIKYPNILIYINRLSDFFFSYARFLGKDKEIRVSQINRD
jgi:cob(I)alamin adenosyltransferase